jgi:hypothetical protein
MEALFYYRTMSTLWRLLTRPQTSSCLGVMTSYARCVPWGFSLCCRQEVVPDKLRLNLYSLKEGTIIEDAGWIVPYLEQVKDGTERCTTSEMKVLVDGRGWHRDDRALGRHGVTSV